MIILQEITLIIERHNKSSNRKSARNTQKCPQIYIAATQP
jgi:hypothetical protein